ncbi:MAG TPA: SpoIIE family protein phosphatase [Miltoncostaeaceae bacterium]|nr:SpoIIE family protein phosphatase [Miltoncostaeaceae bacterium]
MSDTGQVRRIEEELRESRDRLQLALSAASMGIWDWDVATGTLTWSPGLEEIHGMAPGSFDGTFASFVDVVHPDDRARLQADIGGALETGRPFATEFRAVGFDGVVRWITGEGRVITGEDGRPVRMIGVGRDITARRRAEDALRESERRFRAMADAAPVLIWMSDRGGAWTYVNAGWLRFTGRPLDEELGDGWAGAVHPADRAHRRDAQRAAVTAQRPFEVDYRLRRADGEYRWVLDHGVPRWGPDRQFEGFIGSCLDITERRETEEHERLLSEIGLVLDGPLSLEERLHRLARMLLPRIADACVVDLITDDGGLRRAAAAHLDAAHAQTLAALPPPLPASPIGRVAATGTPMLLPEVGEDWYGLSSRDAADARTRRGLGTRSAVVVPLAARGRRIGVMALSTAREHSNRRLDAADLTLAGRIAERAALAIDTARLYEAERTARTRTQFLLDAGAILAESLEYERALQSLARLVVPELADWCMVHLLDARGGLVRAALAHAEPDRARWAAELADRYPPRADDPTGVPAVVRTGQAELMPDIPEEALAAIAQDEEHLRVLREVALTSFLCVPLVARGTTLGALSLLTGRESGRRLGAEDLEVARALGERAAAAIDNARLFSAQRTIADTLQQALLPARLPEVPGAVLGAAYLAVGAGIVVGGDFYDVFPVGEGRWLFVVGDVCGKGPEAAGLTALARYTLRALAPLDARPARLLGQLNASVVNQRAGGMQFLTACAGLLTPRDGGLDLDVVAAGHPPPLVLRADGALEPVDVGGPLIGVDLTITLTPAAVRLGPGDRLVVHTDGITEARAGGALLGDDGLAGILRELAAVPAGALAGALAERVRAAAGGRLRDDLAILVVGAGT